MLDVEADREKLTGEVTPEIAAPQPEEASAEVTSAETAELSVEAALPAVAADIANDQNARTASELAFGGKPTAPSGEIIGGMYKPDEYEAACIAAGLPDRWDPKYVHGHTSASQWTQPYEGRYDMAFALKPGNSASQALRDFLAGPTIADFFVHEVAIQLDELRDEVGDQRFDEMFGSGDRRVDVRVPASQRLKISAEMYTRDYVDDMLAVVKENEAVDRKATEPEEPVIAAGLEETPYQAVTEEPSPELIGAELGIQREQELA